MERQSSIFVATTHDNTNQNLQKACEKKKVMLEYTTPHMPHMNGVIERVFNVIKEGAFVILLNSRLNEDDQKMMWEKSVHMCKHVKTVWIPWVAL